MKTLLPSLVFVLCYCSLSSQQLPLFTQYREYAGFVNPAAITIDYFVAGAPDRLVKVGGGSRLQWVGNESFTISTSILNAEGFTRIGSGNVSAGGGLFFLQDQVDVTSMNGFYGRGAIYVGNSDRASFTSFWGGLGFSVGYVNHRVDLKKLKAPDATDPLLNFVTLNSSIYDIGVGAFGVFQFEEYEKTLMFGISVPQLTEPEVKFADETTYDFVLPQHIFTHLSFFASTSEDFGFVEASIWAKLVEGLQPHVDFNVRYQINSNVWFGAGGSNIGTVHLEVGTNFKMGKVVSRDRDADNYLRIGYGFDMPFNTSYASFLGASHELNMAFVIF